MPKPSTSSKTKSTDSQATGTRASTIGSHNHANDSLTKPEGSSDQTYAMCKEICKEMSESILRCINERFDAFEAKFHALAASQAELQTRVTNQEQAMSDLDVRMLKLEAKCTELTKHNAQLQTKVLDLEARSRRHNIKLVGIPEDEEKGRPTEFVSKLIPKLLGDEHFPHPVMVDRAHRSLQPKPATGTRPRTILARIHHFQQKELILRLGRQQSMEYNGGKVLIFPDYTSEVMAQWRAFKKVLQALRDKGLKYSLRYPAKLYVYPGEDEEPKIFVDPEEATKFLKKDNVREGD